MSFESNLIFELLWQECGNVKEKEIDNMCLSPYEDACIYLEKEGYLQKINSRRYKVIKFER